MKYKVGDKVKIKDDLKPNEYGVTPSMLGYCGKVMTVKSTYSILSAYYLAEDNDEFIWHENTLEPADSKTLRMADGTIIGEFNTSGLVSIHDVATHELWTTPFIIPKDRLDALIDAWAKLGCTTFNLVPDEVKEVIKKTEEKKMPTKFTFYVTEGTRVDKSCNGTIPTMTTNIELLSGNVFDKVTTVKGSATCDKADYDERQGVLEALANAICGGNFYKAYAEAVKLNKCEDELSRTCIYCGKVLDTVEEKQEHEAWHVECRKARHERYLLRKRAKEIAFEEQAQKMAKEMIEK